MFCLILPSLWLLNFERVFFFPVGLCRRFFGWPSLESRVFERDPLTPLGNIDGSLLLSDTLEWSFSEGDKLHQSAGSSGCPKNWIPGTRLACQGGMPHATLS